MKKKTYVIAGLVLILAGGFFYWRNKNKTSQVQVQYVTQTVEKGTLTTSVSASGNVVVDQLATVDPTITGTVADLAVKVGDSVQKGQFLFNIINDQLSVDVIKAESSLEQSQNTVESKKLAVDQAEADYDSAKKKDKADPTAYTKDQLEVLKDKIDIAEDDVDLAKKNLEAASASYKKVLSDASERRVTAPLSGTVNEVNIKNGDDLGKSSSANSSNETPVIIGDLNTLKASVSVNEVDIPKVSIGQKAVLTFDALDSLSVSGKVEKIDSLGTTNQGVVTYNVTIGFDTLDEKIKPQMSVSASIISAVKQDVVLVPSGAVKNDGSNNYVEVLNGETPEQKDVTLGEANNTQTEIVSGVNVGDKVITQTINSNATSTSGSNQSGGGISFPGTGRLGR